MRVSNADVEDAWRVVVISIDPETLPQTSQINIERWEDVPAASVDYPAARQAFQLHVNRLLDQLQGKGR